MRTLNHKLFAVLGALALLIALSLAASRPGHSTESAVRVQVIRPGMAPAIGKPA